MEQTIRILFVISVLSYWIWEGLTELETWKMSSGSQKRPGIYHFWRLFEVVSIDLAIIFAFVLGALFVFLTRWFPEQPMEGFPWGYIGLYAGVRVLGYTLYEAVFTMNQGQGRSPLQNLWYKPHAWDFLKGKLKQPSRIIFIVLFLIGLLLTIRFI